jgi:hypothetical protein
MIVDYYENEKLRCDTNYDKVMKANLNYKELISQLNKMQKRITLLQSEENMQQTKIKSKKGQIEKVLDIYKFKQSLEIKVLLLSTEITLSRQKLKISGGCPREGQNPTSQHQEIPHQHQGPRFKTKTTQEEQNIDAVLESRRQHQAIQRRSPHLPAEPGGSGQKSRNRKSGTHPWLLAATTSELQQITAQKGETTR